ncbi:MAG TPA: mechanosensitive ion channel family protein [Halococcus sp.]|nr:mechanosensitive ion channel family protein [Halococcus sp.]
MPLPLFGQIVTAPLEAIIDGFIEQYAAFVYKFVVFVLTFIVFYLVGRLAAIPLIERTLSSQRITPTVRRPTLKAARAGVVIVAVFAGLFVARLQSLLAVTGGLAAALTLAIGFASRDIIGNLVGGVFIITDPKFNIGDWIEWDGGEENANEGIIEDISFRSTRMRTITNELITVPNSTLANATVMHHDRKDQLRIKCTFCVEYGSDIDAIREVLIDEAEATSGVLTDREPIVIVETVTAAGIDLIWRCLVKPPLPGYGR